MFAQSNEGNDRTATEERIRKIDATISRIVDNIDDANLALLNEKLTSLREEKSQLKAKLEATNKTEVDVDGYRERAKAFIKCTEEVLAEGTAEERKELIRDFIERVEINKVTNEGRLFYRAPFSVFRRKLCIEEKRVKGIEPS